MKLLRQVMTLCLWAGLVAGASSAMAEDEPKDLVLKGNAACTACHDESDAPIGKTRHGTVADTRTGSCMACHGNSKDHLGYKGSGKPPKPDVTFDAKTKVAAEDRSAACQSCHDKDAKRSHWEGSIHQTRDVACTSCHKIHTAKDGVRDKVAQSDMCFTCHKEQRSQVNKPSHHPVVEGKMTCSDCHNVHGSAGPKLLKRNSVVETCYTCHMEKRGPFVRNHQPVTEDCSNCHNPHGTTAEAMLKTRPPFLCNTCHTTPHGPIQPALGSAPAVPGWWSGQVNTQGRSCLSCHTQVHGSNNPNTGNPSAQRLFR